MYCTSSNNTVRKHVLICLRVYIRTEYSCSTVQYTEYVLTVRHRQFGARSAVLRCGRRLQRRTARNSAGRDGRLSSDDPEGTALHCIIQLKSENRYRRVALPRLCCKHVLYCMPYKYSTSESTKVNNVHMASTRMCCTIGPVPIFVL